MDPVFEIKAKLPIEELVGGYCEVKKKGRQFMCVCPFHNDTHPSMQISPDKGIAYCFACNSGGDIFSFYQKIEGVDFRQALKDLGERTGVKIEGLKTDSPVKKDEKERLRDCLKAANTFFQQKLKENEKAITYLKERNISGQQAKDFEIGFAPDSFSDTYQHLLKAGFSRKEIVDASLGIQKDLSDEKIYDRFRNRVMFPIHDGNGNIIGFGGRTLGQDDAKYINSGESPLYHKSLALYGLHHAREAMREKNSVILVEGYFDVLALHRVDVHNVVAVSGTALTEQHVKLLNRYVDKVVLCLDQDAAGKAAAERSFHLCSEVSLPVYTVTIEEKDPDEAANNNPEALKEKMEAEGIPFIDAILQEVTKEDTTTTDGKRAALSILIPLLKSVQSSVERGHYVKLIASTLATTEVALKDDIEAFQPQSSSISESVEEPAQPSKHLFSSSEIALGIMLQFPVTLSALPELIEPEDPFPNALYAGLKEAEDTKNLSLDMISLPKEFEERASILQMYCENVGFTGWSESLAFREVRKNITVSNRDLVRKKQQEIAKKLSQAQKDGHRAEEEKLSTQYQELLKLAKLARTENL